MALKSKTTNKRPLKKRFFEQMLLLIDPTMHTEEVESLLDW